MWALCPPTYHDNDMPIDLRKKVVLQRELDEQRECYRGSEDVYAPKDYSVKEYRDKWQQPSVLPVANLYPFVAEKYNGRCTILQDSNTEKPQDLRPAIRGTLETAIKKLHINSKLKQVQGNGREERCRSAEALLEREISNSPKKLPRSSSCPDLNATQDQAPSSPHHSTNSPNGTVSSENTKNYSDYNTYSPESEDVHSPVIGGARKRKSFVPLYGDRAPVYERLYRSPSPQNLVCAERVYRSPSPHRPVYIRNGYHSPSPEDYTYRERIYRSPSPSPPRPVFNGRHYYSPSPTRSAYDERRYHSPSPKRLMCSDRSFRSPSPKSISHNNRSFHTPSPKRPLYGERGFRSPSPKRPLYSERVFRSPSPKRRPKSPSENAHYDEYFSHPEVLLRRQLSQHSTSPYFLHVYDYYQHLVQRLREQSPNVHINSPVSPTPMEEDVNADAQRKRPCRALTGKHVRQGTGASLSTLLTLRQKIQERQKAKEHEPRNTVNGINGKNSVTKKPNPKKVKMNIKSTLGKIQNC